jgi:hypothetical protein
MRKNRLSRPEGEPASSQQESQHDDRCMVCGREANGKAICADPNCAHELALG